MTDTQTHKHRYVSESLRFNVLIREDAKVLPFADVRAKVALLLNYFKTPSVGPAGNRTRASRTILAPYQLGKPDGGSLQNGKKPFKKRREVIT